MDTIIEKKKGIRKKHIPYVIAGGLVLMACLWLVLGNHSSKLNVDRGRITVATVERDQFNDYIRISGQVQPISTVFLSAVEGGIVTEKCVEEGSPVRQGDVIVRLSNSSLSLQILESETRIAEQQNNLRNTQVMMEQEKLTLRREKLQLDLDVERKNRQYRQYEKLYNEKLISKEDYLQAKENYEIAVDGRHLVIERQKQDSIYRSTQVAQMQDNLDHMRETLLLVRKRVEDLNIKAPVDGQLGLLDVELGQSVGTGSRVGLVSVLSDFKVEAMIDEHYIDRVNPDLGATFERQDRNFALRVRKVFPEVREKLFKTEFVFEGERPDNIRAGQTYYINLQLGQPVEAVIIPRGTFYQTTGGKWIFVLTPDGRRAVRRNITIGRQNAAYYEVLEGLEPGEQVIVSGYETYGDVQELILN